MYHSADSHRSLLACYGQRKLQLGLKNIYKGLRNRTTHLNENIIAWMGLNRRFPRKYQTNRTAGHLVFGLFVCSKYPLNFHENCKIALKLKDWLK